MGQTNELPAGGTTYIKFTTRATTGVPTTLAGSPVVSIYKDDGSTQSVAGVTLMVDFDSVAGLNHVTIDTSADGTFYANGHVFFLVITTGTVNSVSVVGEVVGQFNLSAGVNVIQWNGTNVATPATAGIPDVNVKNINNVSTSSVTTISANQGTTQPINFTGTAGSALVKTDIIDIAGTASVGTAGYVGIDWAHISAPTTTVGLTGTTISSSQVVASVTGAVGSVTGNVGGNVTGSVGSLATQAKTDVENAVWNTVLASHLTAGSTGAALNSAGSAGDPWGTALPGAYSSGTAGFILGTNLNATITSRLAPTVAARTLDVSATGEAGIDWANVGSPTTTVGLTGTTISSAQVVASVTGNVGGNVTGSVASVTGNVGGNVTGSVGSVAGSVGSVTGNVGGNVTGSVASVTAAVTIDPTVVIPEAYSTNGSSATLANLLHEINQQIGQQAISSTTKTVKKRDHSTTAMTFTLDSATSPTSITRAS